MLDTSISALCEWLIQQESKPIYLANPPYDADSYKPYKQIAELLVKQDKAIKDLEHKVEFLKAEIDVLRGVGCSENGDGPCGICIKCAKLGFHVG